MDVFMVWKFVSFEYRIVIKMGLLIFILQKREHNMCIFTTCACVDYIYFQYFKIRKYICKLICAKLTLRCVERNFANRHENYCDITCFLR